MFIKKDRYVMESIDCLDLWDFKLLKIVIVFILWKNIVVENEDDELLNNFLDNNDVNFLDGFDSVFCIK